MNPSGAAVLANPQPSGHIVYPYTDDSHLAEAVGLFATAGLRKGEAVILVMSAEHRAPIRQRLEAEDFNLAELEAAGPVDLQGRQRSFVHVPGRRKTR